jgi:PAS domain S-box-containing protein
MVTLWVIWEQYFKKNKGSENNPDFDFSEISNMPMLKKRAVFELIQDYLRNSPIGFITYDRSLNLLTVNHVFTAVTGYDKKSFATKIGFDLINFMNVGQFETITSLKIEKRESFDTVATINSIDGRTLYLYLAASPIIDKSGEFLNYGIIVIDISKDRESELRVIKELKQAIVDRDNAVNERNDYAERIIDLEKAFKKSSKHHIQLQKALLENEMQRQKLQEAFDLINKQKDELERANAEIREHSRMKELFLANTSHEIRTPLNAIIGFANLLLKEDFNTKQMGYLKNIKASSDNLLVVLNDILDISKIEAGKMTFEKIAFSLHDMVSFLVSTMDIKAQEKYHTLISNIDEDIPRVLIGDPTRLNQILLNLLSNAIKFTPENGEIICTVKLKGRAKNNVEIEFSVSDNGIGMTEDQVPNLFKAFTQAENSTTRKFGGTGLGLSIVKNLVELQDGEIFVRSQINKGTTFTFILPFGIGSDLVIDKRGDRQISIDKHEAENIRILLVEDNKINQQLALDTIRTWQSEITVEVAENGVAALEMLSKNNYSLIFMDIQMPLMDGVEATRRIRDGQVKGKENIPIIAMTAHALKDEKDKCLAAGMNDYLTKPFVPEDLFYKIKYFGSQQVQIMVKAGKFVSSNLESSVTEKQDEVVVVIDDSLIFKNFSIESLNKIYKGNVRQIHKILKMYYDTVGDEIKDMKKAYDNGDLQVTQNRAHALKPKMTYLGRNDIQENAKNIEVTIKMNNFDHADLRYWIEGICSEWQKIEDELREFLKEEIK